MNELLLQTFDGLPLTEPNEHARCSRCNVRLREGKDVVARFRLDKHWKVEAVYCPDCYLTTTKESDSKPVERAVVEGRLITRHDRAGQATTPALHTRGGYKLLKHAQANPDDKQTKTSEVATEGGGC